MKNTESLSKQYHFSRAYKRGKFAVTKCLVVYIFPNRLNVNRLGITIKRTVAKSVQRSRIRRLIKENYRLIEGNLQKGYDIVFVVRKYDDLPDFFRIKKDINYLFRKLSLFLED